MWRTPLRLLALAALLAGMAALALPALAARGKPHSRTIKVGDFFFYKDVAHTPTVHVAKGTLVKWHFVGAVDHNVTVRSGPAKFHSGDRFQGFYNHRVTKRGTYLIVCTIHGFRMRLVVGKPGKKPAPVPQPSPNPYGY